MVKCLGMVFISGLINHGLKGTGRKINLKVLGNMYGLVGDDMLVNGKRTSWKVEESSIILMEESIKANSKMRSNMDMVNTRWPTEAFIKDNG